MTLIYIKQVCLQLPATADNVALPASTAERRAAARLLLTAGPPVVQQSLDICWLPGPQQQIPATAACGGRMEETDKRTDRRTDRQTDGRTDARQMHRSCSALLLAVPKQLLGWPTGAQHEREIVYWPHIVMYRIQHETKTSDYSVRLPGRKPHQ